MKHRHTGDEALARASATVAGESQSGTATARLSPERSLAGKPASPEQVLAIVCVGIVLANLDLFIVNVALPNIAIDFRGADLEALSWVLNAYAIVYAALLVFFGRLVERYRRNASFLIGVALFTAASGACALAQSVQMLVAFRAV